MAVKWVKFFLSFATETYILLMNLCSNISTFYWLMLHNSLIVGNASKHLSYAKENFVDKYLEKLRAFTWNHLYTKIKDLNSNQFASDALQTLRLRLSCSMFHFQRCILETTTATFCHISISFKGSLTN